MLSSRTSILAMAAAVALVGCAAPDQPASEQHTPGSVRVVLASDVEWGPLNPLRGDKSPKAGTLWGDRAGPVPSGFLVRFVDGFSSPPHIHPVTYRGVVVSGLVHNDVPTAGEEWLPAGSFWTQPGGEVHITAAKGQDNVAYIEIEKGPYLVHPEKDEFDSGEKPVKLPAPDMVWVDPPGVPASANGPKIATLPGNPDDDQVRRALVKLPAGFDGALRSRGSVFHVVVIEGRTQHEVSGATAAQSIEPGGYFGSDGEMTHQLACETGAGCVLYVRTDGDFDVVPAQSQE